MKRINIETGQPFRCGDIREDGFIFDAYQKSKMVKKTGYYKEIWRNPESNKREMARKNHTIVSLAFLVERIVHFFYIGL